MKKVKNIFIFLFLSFLSIPSFGNIDFESKIIEHQHICIDYSTLKTGIIYSLNPKQACGTLNMEYIITHKHDCFDPLTLRIKRISSPILDPRKACEDRDMETIG